MHLANVKFNTGFLRSYIANSIFLLNPTYRHKGIKPNAEAAFKLSFSSLSLVP